MEANTPWIIKFGKKEHLEKILNGSLRFCTLSYYRNYEEKESDKGTKDALEGATEIIYPKTTKSTLEAVGLSDDIFEAKSIHCIPKQEKYISCFSYFTEEDIIKKNIISADTLKNENWDFVLLFKNPNDLRAKLIAAIGCDILSGKIHYYDDNEHDIDNLNEFFKPKRFEYQKEFRISFPVPQNPPANIEKLNDDICFVYFEKIEGFICKTSEFQEKIEKSFSKSR